MAIRRPPADLSLSTKGDPPTTGRPELVDEGRSVDHRSSWACRRAIRQPPLALRLSKSDLPTTVLPAFLERQSADHRSPWACRRAIRRPPFALSLSKGDPSTTVRPEVVEGRSVDHRSPWACRRVREPGRSCRASTGSARTDSAPPGPAPASSSPCEENCIAQGFPCGANW